ncbi:MAG: N-acetylmuramoyl-L-alanine amidase [Clostridium sp.]|jgi:N-acetylmuramoyl-L-alanine amidase|nr:N-acetylmuramoyl-L-alanine amidase [Clostridium sp.]
MPDANRPSVIIVIDPGHGGENEGTIENGFQEKSMTLITAKAMYEELSLYDQVTVYLTRTDDRDLSLLERAQYAKEMGADFLFSIHYNASVDHDLFGSEVWVSAQKPFLDSGFRFGQVQLAAMQETGLFLRGVKTRLNDRNEDYYGILREAAALGIPSALLEHCHVDEERDVPFCDTEEELEAFGRADATAAAKYFGLTSRSLGVDYSDFPQSLAENVRLSSDFALKDETPPDLCMITFAERKPAEQVIEISISAADYDSMLLYYDYSIDGGERFSPLQPWPQSDALTGGYQDTFSLPISLPVGTASRILVRAYNLFDGFTQSNELFVEETWADAFPGQDELGRSGLGQEGAGQDGPGDSGSDQGSPDGSDLGQESLGLLEEAAAPDALISWKPVPGGQEGETTNVGFGLFLQICLLCFLLLFLAVFAVQWGVYRSRRKRRRQSRNVEGDRKNHPK